MMRFSTILIALSVGLIFGAGIGFSYAQNLFTPVQISLTEKVADAGLLLEESRMEIDGLTKQLESAELDVAIEGGKADALAEELAKVVAEARLQELEIDRAMERINGQERTISLSGSILGIQADNLTIHLGEALFSFANATEQAGLGNFTVSLNLLTQARRWLALAENDQTILAEKLNELSSMMPENLRGTVARASRQSGASVKQIAAMQAEVVALSLLFSVLMEVSSLDGQPQMADLDRWNNLLDQADRLIANAEGLLEEGIKLAPELKALRAEKVALRSLSLQIALLRETL